MDGVGSIGLPLRTGAAGSGQKAHERLAGYGSRIGSPTACGRQISYRQLQSDHSIPVVHIHLDPLEFARKQKPVVR